MPKGFERKSCFVQRHMSGEKKSKSQAQKWLGRGPRIAVRWKNQNGSNNGNPPQGTTVEKRGRKNKKRMCARPSTPQVAIPPKSGLVGPPVTRLKGNSSNDMDTAVFRVGKMDMEKGKPNGAKASTP